MASLERGRVPSPRSIAIREIPLVDRAEEMKLLKEAVDRAIEGEGGVVFLYGEAGIGKTRLARELRAYGHLRGVQVLYGRCPALFRMDGVPPYILWKEVIKDYLEKCTIDQLDRVIGLYPAEVAKLVPELSQRLGTIPPSFQINPEQEQNRLFEAVSQFIANIAREAPLLVILDDLQWTDPSSLLLLHYLARGVQKTSLLLLGAYRSTDVDSKHPLTSVLAELNRERLPESIQLKRMSLDDVSEMMRSILEQEEVPAEFCRLVYEKTKGNPFFAEEVVKSLKEEGVIYREGNKWAFKDVSGIQFPESVKNVVKARLNRLDEECQNILTMASFIGNDFTLEAMCAVTGMEEDKLLKLTDTMFKTGLIKEQIVRGEGFCSFADVLIRDVVYEEVSPLTRKKTHGVVARALEKVYAETIDDHFGELALHFLEFGDKDKALGYFLKAGDRAAKIYANSEAVSYFQQALTLLDEKEGELREKARVLERLGDVKKLVGEYDACAEYWDDALLLWTQLYEKATASRLCRKIANLLWEDKGETENAEKCFEKALKILDNEPENVEFARLHADLGRLLWHMGRIDEAVTWVEKALELGKNMNEFEVIAEAYLNSALVFTSKGDRKKALQCLERALKMALDNSYIETALRAYNNLANEVVDVDIEKGYDYWKKGFDLAKKVGHVRWMSWMGNAVSGNYVGMGDTTKGLQFAEQSVALDRRTNNLSNLSWSLANLGYIYLILGEWDEAERYINESLDVSVKLGRFQDIARSYAYLGFFHWLAKEDYAKARGFYEKACEVSEKAGAKAHAVSFSRGAVWTSIQLGDLEKAKSLLETLDKFAVEVDDKSLVAFADENRASLFRLQKRWEESIEYFEKSLKEFEALNYDKRDIFFFARLVLCEYARVYFERDEEGDREKAHSLLNKALEMFQKMGARKEIDRVEARIAFVETGKVVSKPQPPERVSTGYADLDKLMYGGIPSGCAVVLTSPSCNERDLLVKSFLEAGAKNGEVTFYITVDPGLVKPLTKEFQSNLYLFICNPQADAIIKDLPRVFKLNGVENLTELGIALTSAIHKLDPSLKGPRRICIGPVSDILLQHHVVQTRRWLTALIPELKSAGFTTLAVIDSQVHPPEELHAIIGLFEGEINVREKETDEGLLRYLKIKRMSNQKYLENELPLKRKNPE